MKKSALKKKVKSLPRRPGVYLFKNNIGKVIYVGKARRLRDRVNSYFSVSVLEGSKTSALVRNISDVEVVEVETDFEAIILEAELIKLYKPKYNIQLKDDKSHLYIVVRDEKVKIDGKKVTLPRIIAVREKDLKKTDLYYGPFPQSSVARYILKAIRKIVPYRDCAKTKFSRYQRLRRPCFYGYINLCSAPCVENISIDEYKEDIKKIQKILEGRSDELVSTIKKEMKDFSKKENYEEAAKRRDLLKKLRYVSQGFHNPQQYIDNPYLVEDLVDQALQGLTDNIPILSNKPRRIEGYDISNLSGKEATGSMVVAIDGFMTKSEYRKFKIKFKSTPDDFEMLKEVLLRRFKREIDISKKVSWGLPDLILIDGGRGQISIALEVLNKYNLNIPVVGLAKKEEIVVFRYNGKFNEIKLEKDNESLKLLQRIRDESHRFAKNYHKQLRLKKLKDV